jgi:carbonic anhydrase
MVAQANVREVMRQIPKRSPILAEMVKNHEIQIAGGVYDVTSGVVEFFEPIDPVLAD